MGETIREMLVSENELQYTVYIMFFKIKSCKFIQIKIKVFVWQFLGEVWQNDATWYVKIRKVNLMSTFTVVFVQVGWVHSSAVDTDNQKFQVDTTYLNVLQTACFTLDHASCSKFISSTHQKNRKASIYYCLHPFAIILVGVYFPIFFGGAR